MIQFQWRLSELCTNALFDIFQIEVDMDRYLREACEKWITKEELDESILTTGEKRESFKMYCRILTVVGGTLMYKRRRPNVPKIVPTPEQVWEVLDPIHRGSIIRSIFGCVGSNPTPVTM